MAGPETALAFLAHYNAQAEREWNRHLQILGFRAQIESDEIESRRRNADVVSAAGDRMTQGIIGINQNELANIITADQRATQT